MPELSKTYEAKTVEAGAKVDNLNVKLVTSATLSGIVAARGGGMVANARITIAKDTGSNDEIGRAHV